MIFHNAQQKHLQIAILYFVKILEISLILWKTIVEMQECLGRSSGGPDAPRKSSEESLSKSHTCRTRMAGSFCSVLSSEKMLSLFVTTTTWGRGGGGGEMTSEWHGIYVTSPPATCEQLGPSLQAGSGKGRRSASWSFLHPSESCSGHPSPVGRLPGLSTIWRPTRVRTRGHECVCWPIKTSHYPLM